MLKAYSVYRRLCVYTVLTAYLKRTYKYRKQHQQLILSYMKPFKHVTSNTIARWVNICLAKSGIDVDLYTAHSVGAASVSKAKNQGVSIDETLFKAGWSNVKTVAVYYDKQIVTEGKFAENVYEVM